jgi:hypothetical protein
MNIYKPGIERRPDGQDVYAALLIADQNRLQVPDDVCRDWPVSLDTWVPLPAIRDYSVKDNMTKALGDRVVLGSEVDPIVLSRRALDVLLPQISYSGQVLPLAFEESDYSFFNVTNVIDALDEAGSKIYKFPSSGRIGGIERYVFKPETVRDQWIFKIPQQRSGFVFVTDRFVELVKSSGLTGFEFKLVWSDEAAAFENAA